MIYRSSSLSRGSLGRSSSLKRGSIKRSGKKQQEWKEFRDHKAERDRVDGVLYCEDWCIGLPACELAAEELDLHHIIEREVAPKLYYDESNLVWLTRECHQKAHDRINGISV